MTKTPFRVVQKILRNYGVVLKSDSKTGFTKSCTYGKNLTKK